MKRAIPLIVVLALVFSVMLSAALPVSATEVERRGYFRSSADGGETVSEVDFYKGMKLYLVYPGSDVRFLDVRLSSSFEGYANCSISADGYAVTVSISEMPGIGNWIFYVEYSVSDADGNVLFTNGYAEVELINPEQLPEAEPEEIPGEEPPYAEEDRPQPEMYFMSTPVYDESARLESMECFGNDKLYLVLNPALDWRIEKLDFLDEFEDFVECSVSADGKYAEFTVGIMPKPNGFLMPIQYAFNAHCSVRYGDSEWDWLDWGCSVELINRNPVLAARHMDWKNGEFYENTNYALVNSWSMEPGIKYQLKFYCGNVGQEMKAVSPEKISVPDFVESRVCGEYLELVPQSYGRGTLSYASPDGKVYKMNLECGTPISGFYTTPNITADNIEEVSINRFVLTQFENTFYFVVGDGYTIDTITPSERLASVADIAVSADRKYVSISLTSPPDGGGYDFDATLNNTGSGPDMVVDTGIILDYSPPKLVYRTVFYENETGWTEDSSYSERDLSEEIYSTVRRNLYYFDGVEYHLLGLEDIEYPSYMTVRDGGKWLIFNYREFGEGEVSYTADNGIKVSLPMNSELPMFTYYTSPERVYSSYIGALFIKNGNRTFYILFEDGVEPVDFHIPDEYANVGTAEFSENRDYIVVRLNGGSARDFRINLNYRVEDGNVYEGAIWSGIYYDSRYEAERDGNLPVNAVVSDGVADIVIHESAFDVVDGNITAAEEVVVDLGEEQGVDTVVISASDAEKLSHAANNEQIAMSEVTVVMSTGSVTLDAKALEKATETGESVSINVTPVTDAGENEKQKLYSKGRTVVDVSVKSGETPVSDFEGGSVTVSIPYEPLEGDDTSELVIWHVNEENKLEAYDCEYDNGTVSFTVPHLSEYIVGTQPYSDVPVGKWFYEPVSFAYLSGIMNGVSADSFSPTSKLTRAMFMTMLARADGVDTSGGATWYEKGMTWAVDKGISDGSAHASDITREQIVTMLWRYAGSPESEKTLEEFTDADELSRWAVEAVAWAVDEGIIKGYEDGSLRGKNTATRAEVAQLMMNYLL